MRAPQSPASARRCFISRSGLRAVGCPGSPQPILARWTSGGKTWNRACNLQQRKEDVAQNVTITVTDIRAALESEDDFGHEMRVGNILRKLHPPTVGEYAKVDCTPPKHGGTYTDPLTGKPRQFDYRYRISRPYLASNIFQCVLLAVECKNLHPSSPLVVSGRARTEDEAYHDYIYSHCDDFGNLNPFHTRRAGSRIYALDKFVGKNLSRLKPSKEKNAKQKWNIDAGKQSDIYEGWSQAVASCQELARDARSFANVHSAKSYCSFIMPVVVVPNKLLWMAKYDNDGSLQDMGIVPTDALHYFVETPFREDNSNCNSKPWFILTHIHFVTMTGFQNLLSGFFSNSEGMWEKMFPPSVSVFATG